MDKLLVTQDLSAVRAWVVARGGWPCRRLDGGLAIGFRGETCRGVHIDWAEFEVNFCARRDALALDDAPGSTRCFVGPLADARSFALDAARRRAPAKQ